MLRALEVITALDIYFAFILYVARFCALPNKDREQ